VTGVTLENLVANALKHTPADAAVEVRLEPLGNDLLIVVEDEGAGIPDEFKERVFDAFDRGSKAFSISPGTGIGLSIVTSFAAVHGGRTWVADRNGGGAAFHVLLPDCLVTTALDREPV
jgi:two-component system OmpR family sensor kinase